jgi:hypothetical protein
MKYSAAVKSSPGLKAIGIPALALDVYPLISSILITENWAVVGDEHGDSLLSSEFP